ncbi:MAG: hypothetical protein HOH43_18640 [Candidatus Latescibacteria bacterium]|nr:hypothetical protein [Candidatus Latescibacterota bacterium]
MTLGDYTALTASAETPDEATQAQKRAAFLRYRPYLSTDDAFDRVFSQAMGAVRDAEVLSGSFPVVVYGPSQGGSAFDNAVLCEFLASHGYIVASVASKGPYSRKMPMNSAGVEAQVRDLEYLAGFLHGYPNADTSRMNAVGFSLGGLSNLVFAMRYVDVDAVVSFDGTIGSSIGYEILQSYPYLDADALRSPFLVFAGNKFRVNQFKFFEDNRFADAHVVKMKGRNHLQFSSFNLMFSTQSQPVLDSYRAMCEYTIAFLNHHGADTDELFAGFSSDSSSPIFGTYLEKRATPAPPSEEEFYAIITNLGVDKGVATYYSVKASFPEYTMMEYRSFRDVGWGMLIERRLEEAIKLFEVLVDAYPDNPDSYRRLGEAHMENGSSEEALVHLRKSLALDSESSGVIQMINRLERE